jgi:thiol:disulfide interchange protein
MQGLRSLLGATLGLALLAAPAPAQVRHATAGLSTKVEGGVLLAALEIKIDRGWYLYHADKGPGDGQPTALTLGGDGLSWGEPVWPTPHRHDQPAIGGLPASFVWVHTGTITIYAAARMDAPESAANATVALAGQTCSEGPAGVCVNYAQDGLRSDGEGRPELWTAFPREAIPAPADEHGGGEADATLHARVRDGKVLAAIEVAIADGWHLYHTELGGTSMALPLVLELKGEGIAWGTPVLPQPERIEQFGEWAFGHRGKIRIFVEGQLAPGASGAGISVHLKGQTCSEGEGGSCIAYAETAYDRGEGDDALFAGAAEAFQRGNELPDAPARSERKGLLAFLGLAVFWGLFTLLMPCTYPMIPITISFFTKQAHARGGKVLSLALLYGAGIVLIFILIGVLVGAAIIPFATHPITNLVIAGFFVLFALSLFGLVNLEPPPALMNLAGRASMTGGYLGVFLMGATLVVTSFTCTAPFVGSLLSVGASDGDLGRIVLGMGTFGLTMAIPFVFLSLVPGRIAAMPRSGQWMNTLKVTLGFLELAAAFKFLSNADLVWEWRVFSRELFLLLWALLFAAAALYLFLLAEGKRARPAGGRSLAGLALLALAAYCLYGMRGRDLDRVMTAIIPNYSGGRFMPEWWITGARHTIVIDDYDAAVARAKQEDKLLLVNFTGITCVNCRLMEENVFPSEEVAPLLERYYVEARLHTDGAVNHERILELQAELTQSVANPYYVLQDPDTAAVLGKQEGYAGPDAFRRFLEGGLPKKVEVGDARGAR